MLNNLQDYIQNHEQYRWEMQFRSFQNDKIKNNPPPEFSTFDANRFSQ